MMQAECYAVPVMGGLILLNPDGVMSVGTAADDDIEVRTVRSMLFFQGRVGVVEDSARRSQRSQFALPSARNGTGFQNVALGVFTEKRVYPIFRKNSSVKG